MIKAAILCLMCVGAVLGQQPIPIDPWCGDQVDCFCPCGAACVEMPICDGDGVCVVWEECYCDPGCCVDFRYPGDCGCCVDPGPLPGPDPMPPVMPEVDMA